MKLVNALREDIPERIAVFPNEESLKSAYCNLATPLNNFKNHLRILTVRKKYLENKLNLTAA